MYVNSAYKGRMVYHTRCGAQQGVVHSPYTGKVEMNGRRVYHKRKWHTTAKTIEEKRKKLVLIHVMLLHVQLAFYISGS